MNVLVINCGSSSIKFGLFKQGHSFTEIVGGQVEKIGEDDSRLIISAIQACGEELKSITTVCAKNHQQAFQEIFKALDSMGEGGGLAPDAIGHRVVHGGEFFQGATLVNQDVITKIRSLCELAPLHNPVNLLGIEICSQDFPDIPQVAIFDTAFHHTLPPKAYRYAVPKPWYETLGIRRYGFHGTSHQYLAKSAATNIHKPLESQKIITLHLGNGASCAAVLGGRSMETSMGFTPLEGLVMGTRSGDIDAMAALEIVDKQGLEQARLGLMNQGGLKGLCGINDMREIIHQAELGNTEAQLAIEVYCHRIRKYIGAYFVVLGGLDALVFSGGVGENSAYIRAAVCKGLECLGIHLNSELNEANTRDEIKALNGEGKPVQILVIKTNEELEIAMQTVKLIQHSAVL